MPDQTCRIFLSNVLNPILISLSLDTNIVPAAQLLLGTALQESGIRESRRRQVGGGPARGLFQMEPNTHDDIWGNFLHYKRELAAKITVLLKRSDHPNASELEYNDKYAAAMARIQYFRMGETRAKVALPVTDHIKEMAAYWKKYYNAGKKGTEDQFITNWNAAKSGM